MASRFGGYVGIPSVVIIGVPDKPALEAVISRLTRHRIDHEAFTEPDFGMGLSAVATAPLTSARQKKAMYIYETWKDNTDKEKGHEE